MSSSRSICRPTSIPASNSFKRACNAASSPSIAANAAGLSLVLLVTGASLDPASICRFQFLTTDASTPRPSAASRDFNLLDATATTVTRFNSSGTGPCRSLRGPRPTRRSTP